MVFDLWRITMTSKFSSLARSGLLALGFVGGLALSAAAAPAGMALNPSPEGAGNLIRVQGDGRYSDCMRGGDCWRPGIRGSQIYRGDGGNRIYGGNGGRRWDGDRHWRPDWNDGRRYYGRRHYGRHYRRNYYRDYYGPRYGSGIYFDFYAPYRYYAPSYQYYEPEYYQPRRVYRSGGSAHVQWCYNRYRSYRAWDNTYQPYNGPRRQCWSPYS
jgi:BA14K-like protein